MPTGLPGQRIPNLSMPLSTHRIDEGRWQQLQENDVTGRGEIRHTKRNQKEKRQKNTARKVMGQRRGAGWGSGGGISSMST